MNTWEWKHPHEKGFFLETEVGVEAGSMNRVVKSETVGVFEKTDPSFFMYTEEVFDLDESSIDPAIFTVPAKCPQ